MPIPRKEPDISNLPYSHKSGAASLLISKAQRLADFADIYAGELNEKDLKKARQAISFYDLALSLLKPYDGNYQTVIHWKCLVLIALEQYEDATLWYRELIRLAQNSGGPKYNNATAQEAQRQLAEIAGKGNKPLQPVDDSANDLLDDPQFCWWAAQFCDALVKRKFKAAHEFLSSGLRDKISVSELKERWNALLDNPKADVDTNLERYEMATSDDPPDYVSWCYFSITGDEVNEAIAMDIYNGEYNYEIRDLEFGRP